MIAALILPGQSLCTAGMTVTALPGVAKNAVVAGSGAFLIVEIDGAPFCSVIDTTRREVIRQIPKPNVKSFIAASRDNLFIVDPVENVVQRWSIATWSRELTVPLPAADVVAAACGSHSDGPLLLLSKSAQGNSRCVFLNTRTMQAELRSQTEDSQRGYAFESAPKFLKASADGSAFCGTRESGSPSGIFYLRLTPQGYQSRYQHQSVGYISPGFDGQQIFTSAGRYNSSELEVAPSGVTQSDAVWLPAADGKWSLKYYPEGRAEVVPPNSDLALFQLADLPPLPQQSRRESLANKIFLFASAGSIFHFRNSPHVDVCSFDFDQELRSSRVPVLAVTSAPQTQAVIGTAYRAPLQILSREPHVSVEPRREWPASEVAAAILPTTEVALPATIQNVAIAGRGRYLLVSLAAIGKVGVIDLKAGDVIRFVEVPSGNLQIAGTATKFFVLSPSTSTLTRFDLATGTEEVAQRISESGSACDIASGAYGSGPVAVVDKVATARDYRLKLLDSHSLESLAEGLPCGESVRASADGRVFVTQRRGDTLVHDVAHLATNAQPVDGRHGAHAVPNFNGSMLFTANGLFPAVGTSDRQRSGAEGWTVPAVHGSLYLAAASTAPGAAEDTMRLQVFSQTATQLLGTIERVPNVLLNRITGSPNDQVTADERLWFVPSIGILAAIPPSNDRVVLRRFELLDKFRRTDLDYLIIDSLPPRSVCRGDTLAYPVDLVSRSCSPEMELLDGPSGASLDGQRLVWPVPKDFQADHAAIRIAIRDTTGYSIVHEFLVEVFSKPSKQIAAGASAARPSTSGLSSSETASSNIATGMDGGPEFRIWTDTAENRKTRATMVRLIDRHTVELKTAEGRLGKIPLNRLSPEDIYYAVARDLEGAE